MRILNFIRFVPCLIFLFAVSCASTPPKTVETRPLFHETASSDVVFQYFSWKTIYMTRPDSHEDGFYPILKRENVTDQIKKRNLGRNLAVVLVGYIYTPDQEAAMFHDWESLLGDCGYRRVVFVRTPSSKKIDGLPIIHESVIAVARADSSKNIASFSAVPSAP